MLLQSYKLSQQYVLMRHTRALIFTELMKTQQANCIAGIIHSVTHLHQPCIIHSVTHLHKPCIIHSVTHLHQTCICSSLQVSPHYDSLLAKLMVWAPTRKEAVHKMAEALEATKLQGTPNNLQLLKVRACDWSRT